MYTHCTPNKMTYYGVSVKCCFACCLLITVASVLGSENIVVVILSQPNAYHRRLAENLRDDIVKQAELLERESPVVHLSHVDFPHVGGWTILPLIPRISKLHGNNSSWILFLEDRTRIDLERLVETLDAYNPAEEVWLGYALIDDEPTIIHHFAFHEDPGHFKYPNVASGFAVSTPLLKRLGERLKRAPANDRADFSIDGAHELALFVWDQGAGQQLRHEPALCTSRGPHCATYPVPFIPCDKPVAKESIYFAVKTCTKFHNDRVKVVKRTWAKYAPRAIFFSDSQDNAIPTVSLGIPNTEQGHCGKTLAILKHVSNEIKNVPDLKWVVIVDDDTILSVSRLQNLLSCYNPDEPVALGERYGFNVHSSRGYNYITGGGGMVFSRSLVEDIVSSGICNCPNNSTPDDMFLGLCMTKMGVEVTHSPLFHQARPNDYAPEYLKTDDAVSFHKHWMVDPVKIYKQWFLKDDRKFADGHERTEL